MDSESSSLSFFFTELRNWFCCQLTVELVMPMNLKLSSHNRQSDSIDVTASFMDWKSNHQTLYLMTAFSLHETGRNINRNHFVRCVQLLFLDSFIDTVIWSLCFRAVRDHPQGLLRVLVMLIRTDFPALRGGTGLLSARYGRVLLRCWKGVHCLSAAWHFRSVHGWLHVNNRFAASRSRAPSHNSYFKRRKLSLSATRQPFTVEIALLFVFSLSNSLFFVSFLRLSYLSHMQEKAGSMPLMQAVAPSPSHNRDGSEKVRTFDKRTHRHKPFDLQRFVSVLWLRHALLRDLVEVWALTGKCSPPDRNRSIFFVQTFVDFALSLPGHSLWVCLRPGPWIFFFSETTNTDKKWKLVPNARLPW